MGDPRSLPVRPFGDRLSARALWALQSSTDAFERLHRGDGYTPCAEHGVDHSGATARFILINCSLHAATGEGRYLQRALRVAHAICGRLGQDNAANDAWVFSPSNANSSNESNKIVAAGDCVDALASFLAYARDRLEPTEVVRIEDCVRLCCDSYLTPSTIANPVPHTRMCGALGLASAHAALHEPAWADACVAALERSLGEMRPDGSFAASHPEPGASETPDAFDLSVQSHSRCVGFARFVARQMEAEDRHTAALRRGADFLRTILRPDGAKPLALESRRWLWDSDTEVGSAPYDAYVLATDGRDELLKLAGRVAARSAQALAPDGLIDATAGSPTLVCRISQTADLAWLARAHNAADLDDLPSNPVIGTQSGALIAADAGVVHLETRRACLILRGNKEPASPLMGGRVGGGGLVYAGHQASGWRNELRHIPEPDVPEATWVVNNNTLRLTKLLPIYRLIAADDRLRLRIVRKHWRASRRRYAARMIWRFLGPSGRTAPLRWQSNHATSAEIAATPYEVEVRSMLARMDGTTFGGLRTQRRFGIQGDRIMVHDRLIAEAPITSADYRVPSAAQGLKVNSEASWVINNGFVHASPLGPGTSISICYQL